jgi:hypothetical protein
MHFAHTPQQAVSEIQTQKLFMSLQALKIKLYYGKNYFF